MPAVVVTTHRRPALAAYAAAAAPALPLDGTITTGLSTSVALVTPTDMARSLWDPVGFALSSLSRTRPAGAEISTSGVFPSPRVTGVVCSSIGSVAAQPQGPPGKAARSPGG